MARGSYCLVIFVISVKKELYVALFKEYVATFSRNRSLLEIQPSLEDMFQQIKSAVGAVLAFTDVLSHKGFQACCCTEGYYFDHGLASFQLPNDPHPLPAVSKGARDNFFLCVEFGWCATAVGMIVNRTGDPFWQ